MKITTRKVITAASLPVLFSIMSVSYAGSCSGPCSVTTVAPGASGGTGSELRLIDAAIGPPIFDAIDGQDWRIKNIFDSITNSRLVIGRIGFSDPFIIEDDASTGTLVIDDNSRVGIGTNAPAVELEIESSLPEIRLDDTDGGGGSVDLHVNGNLAVLEDTSGTDMFVMELNAGGHNQLYLDSNTNIGFGVSNPVRALQFASSSDDILFGSLTNGWLIDSGSGFQITDQNSGANFTPFVIENSSPNNTLRLDSVGRVGMGTGNPLYSLHIKKDNASIFVQDTNGATASNVLLELSKNGIPAMRFTNTSNSSSWDMSQRPNKDFVLSRAGSGAFELIIDQNGNQTVRGSITANGILLTSSRASKTDFSKLETSDVMAKLKKIEVEEWRYKQADKNDRHISPMAEDFYSLFQLGPDNKHINPNDLASVALIAAKELQRKANVANAETVKLKLDTITLKAENDALKERLSSLEKLVTNLASSESLLATTGERLVFNNLNK